LKVLDPAVADTEFGASSSFRIDLQPLGQSMSQKPALAANRRANGEHSFWISSVLSISSSGANKRLRSIS